MIEVFYFANDFFIILSWYCLIVAAEGIDGALDSFGDDQAVVALRSLVDLAGKD